MQNYAHWKNKNDEHDQTLGKVKDTSNNKTHDATQKQEHGNT